MVSFACFDVRVSVMVHLIFVHSALNSVWAAEWQPLPARLAICSHCILSICNFHLFAILVLRAGFRLLKFLCIAFLLRILTFGASRQNF